MRIIGCRHCGRPVRYRTPDDAPYFPFCSRRCKMVDLDKWFSEEHRPPGVSPGVDGARDQQPQNEPRDEAR